jgi:hypothetical protein
MERLYPHEREGTRGAQIPILTALSVIKVGIGSIGILTIALVLSVF